MNGAFTAKGCKTAGKEGITIEVGLEERKVNQRPPIEMEDT